MNNFEETLADYWSVQPAVPPMQPIFGVDKLWEMENDYSYLKYLYPDICTKITHFVEGECDQLEYEGSFMFDAYPDKISLQQIALKILKSCSEEEPELCPVGSPYIRELIEILLCQEMMFRRNRYRNRRRLYF